MIDTVRAKTAPHDALPSSRKLIPLENVVWRSLDLSLAAIDPLPHDRQNIDNVGNPRDIISVSEVAMNTSVVPSKVHWQNADRSDQAGKSANTPASPQQSPQPMPGGETV